jgi:hypothetical protein
MKRSGNNAAFGVRGSGTMQRDPAKTAYGYAEPTRAERGEQPMSMLDAALFFGVLAVIFDGIGLAIGRVTGIDAPVLACINPLLYVAAGFVGARYAAIANGVWAGIMTATLDTIFGTALIFLILPEYRDMFQQSSSMGSRLPSSFLVVGIIFVFIIMVVWTLLAGSFFGFIGGAISRVGIFRPKDDYYADEY